MLPYGRKNPLPFLYSLSSENFAVLFQRETGVKRVETVGVYPFGFRGETAAVPLAAGAARGYISPPTYNRSRGPLQYESGPPANPQF